MTEKTNTIHYQFSQAVARSDKGDPSRIIDSLKDKYQKATEEGPESTELGNHCDCHQNFNQGGRIYQHSNQHTDYVDKGKLVKDKPA